MPDFLTRIAPWTVLKTGLVSLAAGVRSAALVPTVPAGMARWFLVFGVANMSGLGYTSVELQYGPTFLPLVRLMPMVETVVLSCPKLITSGPNELYIQNIDALAAQDFPYTIGYADTPPNVLSNFVAGQYAG